MITSKEMKAIKENTLVKDIDDIYIIRINIWGEKVMIALSNNYQYVTDDERDHKGLWFLSIDEETKLKDVIKELIKPIEEEKE